MDYVDMLKEELLDPEELWPSYIKRMLGIPLTEEQMREKEFWSLIRDELVCACDHIDLQRIESGSTGPGIPDVNYCVAGVEGWIELKVARVARRAPHSITIGLRVEQAFWLARRRQHGGRSWILAAIPKHDETEGSYGDMMLFSGLYGPTLYKNEGSHDYEDLKKLATAVLPRERGKSFRTLLGYLKDKPGGSRART